MIISGQISSKKPEYRAITIVGGVSMTIVLPRQFCAGLGLGKGDFVRVTQEGKKIILEKAD